MHGSKGPAQLRSRNRVADPIPYDIELTRIFEAPRERLYEVFTDPDQFARWYGPAGFPVPRDTIDLDARVGGPQRFTMVGAADPSMQTTFDGNFTEVVTNQLLASTGNGTASRDKNADGRRTCGSNSRTKRQDTCCGSRGPSSGRDRGHWSSGLGDDVRQDGRFFQRLRAGVERTFVERPGGERLSTVLRNGSPWAPGCLSRYPVLRRQDMPQHRLPLGVGRPTTTGGAVGWR